MKPTFLNVISSLMMVAWLAFAGAPADARDFYSASVPVADSDSPEARAEGLGRALRQVVTQVTGDRQFADSARLQPEYASAARYATEYRFVETPEGLALEVRFEPSAVDVMLQRQGAVGREDRASVLVWLAGPVAGVDQLLPADLAAAWDTVDLALRGGGYTMVRPLMDFEDQTRLSAADLARRSGSPIREASVRYAPDAMISAYLAGGGDQWQADWMLLSGEVTRRWSTRGADQATALRQGAGDAVGMLAELLRSPAGALDLGLPEPVPQRSPLGSVPPPGPLLPSGAAASQPPSTMSPYGAPTPAAPQSVTTSPVPAPSGNGVLIRVSGIGSSRDYRRAMDAFKDNSVVSAFEVVAVEPDSFVVSVTPAGAEQALADALTGSGALQAEPSGAESYTSQGIDLYFRVMP